MKEKRIEHTTKLSVAPAAQPVAIDSSWVILVDPVADKIVFPQKSFAALANTERKRSMISDMTRPDKCLIW